MLAVTPAPLSIDALTLAVEAAVRTRGEGCGALASFLGVVRGLDDNAGIGLLGIDDIHECHGELALGALRRDFAIVDRDGNATDRCDRLFACTGHSFNFLRSNRHTDDF